MRGALYLQTTLSITPSTAVRGRPDLPCPRRLFISIPSGAQRQPQPSLEQSPRAIDPTFPLFQPPHAALMGSQSSKPILRSRRSKASGESGSGHGRGHTEQFVPHKQGQAVTVVSPAGTAMTGWTASTASSATASRVEAGQHEVMAQAGSRTPPATTGRAGGVDGGGGGGAPGWSAGGSDGDLVSGDQSARETNYK